MWEYGRLPSCGSWRHVIWQKYTLPFGIFPVHTPVSYCYLCLIPSYISTSWNSRGLSRPAAGKLYFFALLFIIHWTVLSSYTQQVNNLRPLWYFLVPASCMWWHLCSEGDGYGEVDSSPLLNHTADDKRISYRATFICRPLSHTTNCNSRKISVTNLIFTFYLQCLAF